MLGRAEEAEPLVPEVRLLAVRLGNGIDGIRTTWLEANCATGLGRREEALEKLDKVREGFEGKSLPLNSFQALPPSMEIPSPSSVPQYSSDFWTGSSLITWA